MHVHHNNQYTCIPCSTHICDTDNARCSHKAAKL